MADVQLSIDHMKSIMVEVFCICSFGENPSHSPKMGLSFTARKLESSFLYTDRGLADRRRFLSCKTDKQRIKGGEKERKNEKRICETKTVL